MTRFRFENAHLMDDWCLVWSDGFAFLCADGRKAEAGDLLMKDNEYGMGTRSRGAGL